MAETKWLRLDIPGEQELWPVLMWGHQKESTLAWTKVGSPGATLKIRPFSSFSRRTPSTISSSGHLQDINVISSISDDIGNGGRWKILL